MKLGPLALPGGSECLIYDFSKLREVYDRPIYGIIGMDVIGRFAVQLDWDSRKLRLLSRGFVDGETDDSYHQIALRNGRPHIGLGFPNRTAIACMIDTGMNSELLLKRPIFDALVVSRDCTLYPHEGASQVAGGTDLRHCAELRQACFLDPDTPLDSDRMLWVPDIQVDCGGNNLIGVGYLSRFRIRTPIKTT